MDPVEQIPGAPTFTLRAFVAEGAERLRMEVVVGGDGLEHEVLEPMCNRPGLALTGFYGFFAWRRIQVIGQAEQAYLDSLAPDVRLARVKALFDRGAYCLIFACGIEVPAVLASLAESAGVVVCRTELLTRIFFHQATFVLEKLRAPKMRLYGTTVEVAGLGVMLEGAPGLGKSETALGLIKHGNALVADDLTCLRKDVAANRLFAAASPATRNYMEIRGIGIIHVPSVFGVTAVRAEKELDLVVTLKSMKETEGELDRTGEERRTRTILGVEVPQITIPVAAGRDLVNLVETAAQQYKLLAAGHDAVKALDAQLCARAEGKL
ncbi:MAG: HPr(Ser) kinase/phosphatase [bacterium]|nr:HPr(Ser) kinase/phosphatase [bacterium]